MKLHLSITLFFLISFNCFSQISDFKIIEASKTSNISIERSLVSESLTETITLPEGKKFLIVTAELNYDGEMLFMPKKEDISIGEEKNYPVGNICNSRRADFKWGFRGTFWQGKNFFNAVFIIDSEINSTQINILEQNFKIPQIAEKNIALECLPKVVVKEKEYLKEITSEDKFNNNNKQPYTKIIKPASGILLSISLDLEFCEKAEYFKRKAFNYEPTYFQLVNKDGVIFDCQGTINRGQFSEPIIQNILKEDKITHQITLVFCVPLEGNYNINYMGNKVGSL